MSDTKAVNNQKIKVVILAGGRDFGRCPLASQLPTALWPVLGKPAVNHLLEQIRHQGIKKAIICSNGDGSLLQQSINACGDIELEFLDEQLPVGTAGAIRNAVASEAKALLLVLPASIICPPQIDMLVKAHHDGKSDMTVMLNPSDTNGGMLEQASGIYVCSPDVLEHIPEAGYFDIKEGLIPEMLRAGKTIHTATLPNHAGNFRDRQGYLEAITNYLESTAKLNTGFKLWKQTDRQTIWKAANSRIEPGVRIYGQVVIMEDAIISEDTVIFGPTVIGRNARIGRGSLIVNSVLWDGAQVGPNCKIQRCIVDYGAVVPANTVEEEKPILLKPKGLLESSVNSALKIVKNNTSRLQHALQQDVGTVNKKLPNWIQIDTTKIALWIAACLVLIAFLWSYWPGLVGLWRLWQRSDEYSSGLLVPFLAIYILWSRRHNISQCEIRPSVWGLLAFIAAQSVRLFGLFFMYGSAERLSIALSIAALVLFLFGWQLFRKVSTVLLFLCLMLPWPNRVQAAVALPLQRWATSSAVFCLEMMGYEVFQEGNIIHIGQASVAVAEACNGLRMVMAFFVITGLVVLLARRAWWEKLIILASSLPIALLCNTIRLAITAVAFTIVRGEHWERIFHDFGGYAMMPVALALVVAELWLLMRLTTVSTKEEAIIITRQK
ncbi:MAG: exosortase [Planctomycetota bacterium]|nr:MAG: exosortase [Planctomycetota bacterium]